MEESKENSQIEMSDGMTKDESRETELPDGNINKAENREIRDISEVTKLLLKGLKREESSSDEESSPRGVLEIPIMRSDSDQSSVSESSPSVVGAEKSPVHKALFGETQWKHLVHNIKKKSMRRFSTIPLLSSGYEFSRKNLRRKVERNRSASCEDPISIDVEDIVFAKPSWRSFSFEELSAATHNFSSEKLIGKGGHAEVYKGQLPDGQVVAVKKIMKKEKLDDERVGDFLSELGIIAHITHKNAAKLIGFSVDTDLHLVFQYLPNGSLATVLHGSTETVEWKTRFKVAVGVAEGLQYLHCHCQRRIIHRDITASNILLGEDYEPQISDFGLAKWLPEKWTNHVVSPIEGTFGYMAPEYFMHGIVDEKIDVFAFGVLLLELITGRRAVDSCRQSLVMWAKPHLETNNVKEVADPRLGDGYDLAEMKRAMSTACACVHHLPSMRPNMHKVVKLLMKGEEGQIEMKQKSLGGRALMLDACDLEDYTCTSYLNDLNRHMQLVME